MLFIWLQSDFLLHVKSLPVNDRHMWCPGEKPFSSCMSSVPLSMTCYSDKLPLRMGLYDAVQWKTLEDLKVLWLFAKVFSAKFGSLVSRASNLQKSSPTKVSCYYTSMNHI